MKKFTAIALSSTLLAGVAFAEAKVVLNEENKMKIKEMLTEQGYEVGKIKIEDGMYEAYAKNDDGKFEIFLNGDFEIIRTEDD